MLEQHVTYTLLHKVENLLKKPYLVCFNWVLWVKPRSYKKVMGSVVFTSFKLLVWALLDTAHIKQISKNFQIHAFNVKKINRNETLYY